MISIRYVDLVLTLIAVSTVVISIYVAAVAHGLRSALAVAGKLGRDVERLLPRLELALDEARSTLASVERVSSHAAGTAREVETLAGEARRTLAPTLHEIGAIAVPLRQAGAVMAGVKAGLATLSRSPSGDGHGRHRRNRPDSRRRERHE